MSRVVLAIAGMLVFLAFPYDAPAQQPIEGDIPVLLQADELSHDRELGIVIARGNVEISRLDRVLLADSVTYNQRDNIMTAQGNITLLEPTGEVVFSEYVELSGDLKDGIVRDIRMILSDGARLAANGARRTGGTVHELRKAVYSPCEVCREDPSKAPLWQVKAIEVTHNKPRQEISYKDAWLEIAGVPVFYTPYFTHPDPTVKRRTGLLTPSFGNSSDLGTIFRAPYYFNIDPWQDLTVTPTYTSKEGPVLAAEYRRLFKKGEFQIESSITEDSEDDVRGHIDAEGKFDLDDTWRMGFEAERSSDDTYMRRYNFGSEATLTSRLYAEGFRKRNYVSVDAYAFQGLEENDDPGTTPLVLPTMNFNHVSEPGKFGARTRLDANVLSMTRTDGTDTQRVSVNAGWEVPYIAPKGDIYLFSASVRGDGYYVNDLSRPGKSDYDGFSERLLYEMALHWRYPLSRTYGDKVLSVVEPMASVIVSPYGGNPDTIPNEDSQDFEFDDTNLFSTNRYPGLDRVEGGPRVNYGLRWGVYGLGGGHSSFLIGQSARLREDDTFADGSGLEDHISDVVLRAKISPNDKFDLIYRTRLDKDNFEAKRNEVSVKAGPDALKLSSSYVYFARERDDEFSTSREEFRSSVTSKINRYWRSGGSLIYNLESDETQSMGLDLIYEDECLAFTTTLRRTFFVDRDIKPTDTVLFRVNFKTLGELST
jgi:LPS-assembly protein